MKNFFTYYRLEGTQKRQSQCGTEKRSREHSIRCCNGNKKAHCGHSVRYKMIYGQLAPVNQRRWRPGKQFTVPQKNERRPALDRTDAL